MGSCVWLSVYREVTVKYNDYFEFPREFDMAPYTATHFAKVEGQSLSEHLHPTCFLCIL